MLTKNHILTALRAWINQRPGLEFGNYGEVSAYRSELRSITKDRAHALKLLQAVELRDSITADDLIAAFSRAYSGRLSISEATNRKGEHAAKLDYCTGQYWPTEYRKAAAAVLASALWDAKRSDGMPDAATLESIKQSPGTWLRESFRREFGRSIQSRWFD